VGGSIDYLYGRFGLPDLGAELVVLDPLTGDRAILERLDGEVVPAVVGYAAGPPAGQSMGTIVLVGEAGVGKTRLLREVRDWCVARGAVALVGRAPRRVPRPQRATRPGAPPARRSAPRSTGRARDGRSPLTPPPSSGPSVRLVGAPGTDSRR
jgi:hypothetical protein